MIKLVSYPKCEDTSTCTNQHNTTQIEAKTKNHMIISTDPEKAFGTTSTFLHNKKTLKKLGYVCRAW
jgi:hypothetical protein